MDGFDHYTEDQLERKWSSQSGSLGTAIGAGAGRRGTDAWRLSNLTGNYVCWLKSRTLVSGGVSTFIGGIAVYLATFNPGNGYKFHPFLLQDASDTSVLSLSLTNTTNRVCARLAGGSTIVAEGTTQITTEKWWYLEIKAYIHNTAGTCELRVNGVTEANETGLDTQGGSLSTIDYTYLYHNTYVGDVYFDDLYICDNNGSTNNDFLGDCKVETLLPNGAGASTDWTPSTGSNYQCVDDNPSNDDTDYVSETTAGDHDTYTFDDLATTSGTVYGVQHMVAARKADAGSRTLKTYDYYMDILEEDPDTSSQWTISGVNSAEFGQELES
jgi:hypothetical protein